MDLHAWRDAVPTGAFLQPIRLAVAGASSKGQGDATGRHSSSEASAPPDAPPTTATLADAEATATATTAAGADTAATAAAAATATATAEGAIELPSTTKPVRRLEKVALPAAQTRADSLDLEASELLLEPFEGARVQRRGDRMALNVGGPVWALDWLPPGVARRKRRSPTAKSPMRANGSARPVDASSDSDSDAADDAPDARAAQEQLARDWRFLALSTHPPCEVVDGKLAKPTPPDHYFSVGESAAARGLVQIWAIPVHQKTGTAVDAEADDREPKLVFAIDHESGVAWDLQWSPLVSAMPKRARSKRLLGVLAVCFGDGSVQVFEVPAIAPEALTPEGLSKPGRVERLRPTIRASVPSVLQLSVQWSPHRWNLILTGGSDGSVCLWNLEWELSPPEGDGGADSFPSLPMEPQRRFQDVDTVGKQEAFEWGWGWVAVRAVAWSPFDEFVFATTGNDSIFKVWDIREPRICVRSHRIRSTWGLSLQWMDQTSIQISGDQGMVYMYDIMSGSCQKLYYHPQTDSPVWNLEFARRESDVPLLASCCASGSVRVAPAKRLFRATQHSVELFRLNGEHDASVNKPYKELRASFERKIVAEPPSPAVREFCERDAALHRLRVSTSSAGVFPCFIAAGGHAGLVVVMELQEALDSILRDYFLPASRKLGRPRKVGDPWGSAVKAKGKTKKTPGAKKARAVGPKPAKAKKMVAPGDKKKRKPRAPTTNWDEEPSLRLDISEDEFVDDGEADEDESTSSLSLMMAEDNSDDDRVTISSDEMDDEPAAQPSAERARLMSEYQMDLHEDDAIMLAIQMSEMEQPQPQPPSSTTKAKGKGKAKSSSGGVVAGSVAAPPANDSPVVNRSEGKKKLKATSITKQSAAQKKRPTTADAGATTTPSPAAAASKTKKKPASHANDVTISEPAAASAVAPAQASTSAAKKPSQSKKAASKASGGKGGKAASKYSDGYIMNQVATLQMIRFQNGMTEEDALLEVLRISEAEAQRSSSEGNAANVASSRATEDASVPPPSSDTSAGASISTASARAAKPRSKSASATTVKKQPKKKMKAPAAAKASKAPVPAPVPVPEATGATQGSNAAKPTTEEATASGLTSALPSGDAAVIDEAKEPEQPTLPVASTSTTAKRKRPAAKPTQPRKRPSKSATTTSKGSKPAPAAAGSKASDAQVASGYLTDEEALYLALRASEVEY